MRSLLGCGTISRVVARERRLNGIRANLQESISTSVNQDSSISAKNDFVSSATEATFRMILRFFS